MASRGLLDVEVGYLDARGDEVTGPLSGVDAEAVVTGRPVRRFPSYKNQGNYPGWLWSVTMDRLIGYESLLEARRAALQLGISPTEWAALNCLNEQPGLSQREVAELLGIDRTRMVALLDELQAKGWVERRTQPEDRRKNIVTLTGRGVASCSVPAESSTTVNSSSLPC